MSESWKARVMMRDGTWSEWTSRIRLVPGVGDWPGAKEVAEDEAEVAYCDNVVDCDDLIEVEVCDSEGEVTAWEVGSGESLPWCASARPKAAP